MKTLDEVIEKLEFATRVSFGCVLAKNVEVDDLTDALHYLREYREYAKAVDERYAEIEKKQSDAYWMWVNKTAELERNDPLTWDELKTMEGKPVWVEWASPRKHYREWFLLDVQGEGTIVFRAVNGDSLYLSECDLGKTWQAYRKERNDNA